MLGPCWSPRLMLAAMLASGTPTTWQSQADNKSVAVLSQLGAVGLISEGRAVCVAGAAASPEAHHIAEEAKTYLGTLGRVAQQQEPDALPSWVALMQEAIVRQDTLACNAIWAQEVRTYLAALLSKTLKRLESSLPVDPL
jgi:hypothetical protein